MPKNATILERWLEKVALGDLDDCWPWMAQGVLDFGGAA